MKKDKKIGRMEYIIITIVIGLLNNSLIMIIHSLDTIYEIQLINYPFYVYWIVLIIFGFITGFFYVSIWAIIKKYFGDKIQ